ncbi:hypothetical protein Bca4012_054561 [Brassica carinata]
MLVCVCLLVRFSFGYLASVLYIWLMNKDECKKMPTLAHWNEHYCSGFWPVTSMDSATSRYKSFVVGCFPKLDRSSSRIDKQALFEQARKNMCSSRYNGLLLESFSHIVSYGKSFQQKKIHRKSCTTDQ